MSDEHTFTEYCEKCGRNYIHRFMKDQLRHKSSNLYSGIFLHRGKDNEEIHAVLAYFDKNLANRGIEASNLIQPNGNTREYTQENTLPSSKEGININQDIKIFYEWLINEYIFFFKDTKELPAKLVNPILIKLLASKRVNPILIRILEALKSQSKIYEKFELSDETNSTITSSLQDEDLHKIKESELKRVYQTLFDHIKKRFREENEKDALEASRKLELKINKRRNELVKLGLSEDVLRILETQS
jgi:hypothetical protein